MSNNETLQASVKAFVDRLLSERKQYQAGDDSQLQFVWDCLKQITEKYTTEAYEFNLAMDIFADGLPADWADYEFWLACIEPIKKTDLKNQTIAFLKAFSAEYPSYDMSATILCVESLTIEQINQIVES